MKMFRKLASVFLSLSMLAAIPQVKAEENPEPTNDSEEIVLTEPASEETVSEEIVQEESREETISETAEPAPEETVTEEPAPETVTEEPGTEEPAPEENVPEEETLSEPLEGPEEESIALDADIVMMESLSLPLAERYSMSVKVNVPGKTIADLDFESDDSSIARIVYDPQDNQVYVYSEQEGVTTVRASLWENDQVIASAETVVTVSAWLVCSDGFLKFSAAGETKEIQAALAGAAEGMEFELVPPLEDKDNPIVEAVKGEGNAWTIKALRPGRSILLAHLADPNPGAAEGSEFYLFAAEVLVTAGTTPTEIKILHESPVKLTPGRTEEIMMQLEPAEADPTLVEFDTTDGSIVAIRRDETYPYRFYLTADAVNTGEAFVTFNYGEVCMSMLQVSVSQPYANLPGEMFIPVNADVKIPIDTNIRELYDGGAVWTVLPETDMLQVVEIDNAFYLEAYEPTEAPYSVGLSVTMEDESVLDFNPISVTAANWVDYDESLNELFFVGKDSEATEVTIPYFGPEECAEFKLVPPLEDKDDPLVEATYVRRSAEGVVFSVKPLREGRSVLFAEVKNPYDENSPFILWIGPVTVIAENQKPKKILLDTNEAEMEPDMTYELHFHTDPDTADPFTVSVKSSNPALVDVVRSDYNPYSFVLNSARDQEGTATITLSAGSVKATCTVNVIRSIVPDKHYLPILMGEDKGSVTVTLRGRGRGGVMHFRYLDGETWEPIEPEAAPFIVEEVTNDGDVHEFSVTPLNPGRAIFNFWYENEHAYGEAFTDVEVREMERIKWRDNLAEDLQDRIWQNKEEVYLETRDIADPKIEYAITYYRTREEAEADTTEPSVLYQNHFTINSKYLGESYAKLRAIATKAGLEPSVLLDVVLAIRNDDLGIWDWEHRAYVEEKGLDKVHNELCIYGVPDAESEDEMERALVTYSGQAITFNDNLRVWYGTRYLEEGRDYKVSYSNNKMPALKTAAKAPSVTITGQGDFKDKVTIKFTILKKDVNEAVRSWITVPDKEGYRAVLVKSGFRALTPKVTVMLRNWDGKETKLTEKKEYTLLYYPYELVNNEIVIKEPVTSITEAGRYIIAVKASDGSATLTGDPEAMEPEEKRNYLLTMPGYDVFNTDTDNVIDMDKAKLSKNIGTLNLKRDEIGYYDEEELQKMFLGDNPEIKVTIGNRQLKAWNRDPEEDDADFVVYTTDMLQAGSGNTLVLAGMENFEKGEAAAVGIKMINFSIEPVLKMSSSTVKITGLKDTVTLDSYDRFQVYKDGESDPNSLAEEDTWDNVFLWDKSGNFINRDNYYYEISDYRRGTGTITVTFHGKPEKGYTGSVSKKIKVTQPSLKDLSDEGNVWIDMNVDKFFPQAEFAQAGAKPEYRVIYRSAEGWERELEEGVDFTASWSDNKKLTADSGKKGSLTIKGKGYFKDSLQSVGFEIVPADFDHMYWGNQLTVSCPDVVYNAKGKAGYFHQAPTVYDGTKKLTAGKDYRVIENGELRYAENFVDENGKVLHVQDEPILDTDDVPVGARIASDQKIEILNPNYTYSRPEDERWIHAEYRIVTKEMNISSATVVVNNKQPVFLGEDWNVMPEIEVTLKKEGLSPEDYVIETIENNWKIGTATMILRGVGKFCGTKKVTFKIDKSPIQFKED